MDPDDIVVVVLKDILLSWLGFRFIFIYIVYISWHYIWDVSYVLLPPTGLSFFWGGWGGVEPPTKF